MVVDGSVAFTGGMNIGDEYLGKGKRFGYWRDTDVPLAEPSISSPSVALLPSDVNSLLVARLDRLPPRVKLTVLAAAVLGKEFDLRVLKQLSESQQMALRLTGPEELRIFATEQARIWGAVVREHNIKGDD